MKQCALPVYNKNSCKFFALGRNAIYAACKILNLKSGDEVLTPAFDCDGTLQPFIAAGCTLRFFKSNPFTFEADIENLRTKITSATRLIHVINHFGIPQPWEDLLALRKSTGIPILEDNAYSLFSRWNGRWFGEFGDVSIFSFRKNLPIIDGGMLKINSNVLRFDLPMAKPKLIHKAETIRVLDLCKRKLLSYYKLSPKLKLLLKIKKSVLTFPPLYSETEDIPIVDNRDIVGKEFSCDYLRPMSKGALLQLSQLTSKDFQDIINKKIASYSWLCEELKNIKGIRVLMPQIPQGVVPFSVFLLIDSNRDMVYRGLSGKFEILTWPTLPVAVLRHLHEFPEVKLLGKKLLLLNLPADMVRRPDYKIYLRNLAIALHSLAKRYLP